MINIIIYAGTTIGIAINIFSLVRLIKLRRKINNLTDEQFYFHDNISNIKKCMILSIIGISIISIFQLIKIFFRG